MLDNLKLGYGGTKAELERLIADAASYTDIQKEMGVTVDASSMSFDNIVNAIAVVQGKLGIAGATALEAGTTIEGSVNSMKAAWDNLITGVADKNADLEGLIGDFVTTIVGDGTESNLGVLGNIMPAVKSALNGASRLVSEMIPIIVQEIPSIINDNLPILAEAAISIIQSLVDGISQNQEMLMETAFDTIKYLATSLIKMLPDIIQVGVDLIVSLIEGIAEMIDDPVFIQSIIDVILKIVDILTNPDSITMLLNAAVIIIVALAKGLIQALPQLLAKVPEIIRNLAKALGDFASPIFDAAKTWGKDLMDNFVSGIKAKIQKLKDMVSSVAQTVKDFLGFSEPKKGPLSNFHTYAPDMMDLFAKGIRENEDVITDQIEKSFDFGERTMKFGAEYGGGYGAGAAGGVFGGTSFGTVNINIDGANVQDDAALADMIAERLQRMTERRGAVFA